MNAQRQRFWLTWLIGLLMLSGLLVLLQMPLDGTAPVLAQAGTGTIRVAMIGTDAPGCGSTGAPCRTVQYAVDQAAEDDEIHIAAGLYSDVSARYGVTQVVYIEETVTIRGGYTTTNWATPDPDANPTVLSALGQGRVIYVTGAITPALVGLRLTGGSAIGLGGYIDPSTLREYDGGGAVYAAYATLTITDCQIDTNGAEVGGGIALFQSPARIYNSSVLTNQAGYGGGLAMGYSPAILDGNTIAGNQANYGGGMGVAESGAQITNNTIRANEVVSSGGGIALFGNPPSTLSGNMVIENNARWGGGLVISGSTSYVYSNTFMANTSIEVGGGINLDHCDARLVDNLVQANDAGHSGGGIFFIESTAVLTGNHILSNTTDQSGGGIYMIDSPARLYDNTIHANSATYAGGGLKMRGSAAQLVNNTISANTCQGAVWDERGGGGLYMHDSNGARLDGNQIVRNMARYYGGGVYLRESVAELTGNTVSTNTVDTQSEWNGGGGGFYLDNSDGAILTDNTIAANLVFGSENTHGGGLFLEGSDAQLTGNRVLSNIARSSSSWANVRGGGLYIESSNATLTDNTIISNTVQGDDPDGGGMYVQGGAPTIVSNTLTVNTAERGGGGYFQSSEAIVRYNTVVSNTASWFGGGFYFNSGSAFLDANTVMSNTARTGSGILVAQSTGSVLVNNIVAHNNISGSTTLCKGGGLFLYGASPSVAHNTFVDNHNTAICVQDIGSQDSTLWLTNTIIVSHTTGVYVESDGSNAILEHTLWSGNTSDWSGPVTDNNPITGMPDFVDAGANDYHIGPASAGLDLGAIVDVVSDIDGDPRPANSGYDVGADERPGVALSILKAATPIAVNPGEYVTYTVLVSSVGVVDATSVALTDTLPAEVRVQNAETSQGACTPGAGWGATVTCALGTLSPGAQAAITLTVDTTTTMPAVLPALLHNVAVVRAAETLSGTAEADSWLQNCHARLNDDPTDYTTVQAAVDAATQDSDVVKVAGGCAGVNTYGGLRQQVYLNKTLTIRGGYTTGDWDTSDPVANPTVLDALELGRVVYIAGTVMPVLEGLHIQNGDATGLGGYVDPFGGWVEDVGGGVYGQAITPTISGCWIEHNYAVYGGGVYLDASAGVITGTTVASNTATNGGGVYLSDDSVTLTNNSVTANEATSGGGLFLGDSAATLNGNAVATNTASSGGGLYLEQGTPTLSVNTISSNTARYGGGLYTVDDYAVITDNVIISNSTYNSGDGGGLHQNNSHNTVFSNTIVANYAEGEGGGAFLSNSSSQYTANRFSNNTASAGGGAFVDGDNYSTGPAGFIDNTFFDNAASGSGGGLRLVMGTNTISGNVMISNTAKRGGGAYLQSMVLNNVPQPIHVIGNTAMSNTATLYGGGFFISGPRPYLDRNKLISNTAHEHGGGLYVNYRCQEPFNNTVIVDNHADQSGGGIYVNGASPQMQHTTIARNTSGDGRAVYIIDSTYDSNVGFTNTILVSATTGIYADTDNTAMLNGVLWYSVTTHSDGGGAVTVTNAITGDPAFDSDGYHLMVASQALDQGVDAGLAEDIDSQIRPMGFGFDLGADEYLAPTLLLDKNASANAVDSGRSVTYTVVFTAAAGGTVHNVTLTDTLDAWQQPLTAVSSLGGCVLVPGWGGGAVCTIGDMPLGTIVWVTVTAQVSPTTPLQQQVSNDAVARGDEAGATGQASVYVHFCRARINDGATEYASIQAAVDAASDGDLVKVAGGLCLGASERGGEWQQGYVTKTVTLRGGYDTATWTTSDPDGNPTTLDALGQGRVFYIAGNSIRPVVEDFRITGGNDGLYGGGVYVETASATLNRNHVYGNQASDGGGIYLNFCDATLDSNIVSTNTATTDGAGLYLNYAPALLRDNRVFGNLCPGDYCDGGGLRLYYSDATLTGNAIFSNIAAYGGGLYAHYSDATLRANTITSNTITRDGGGVYLYRSSAILSRDVIRNNVANRDGGGLFMSYTSIPRLTNIVIADNQAASNGSGIYNDGALPRIVHTTIARNTGGDGSGVYIAAGTSTALTNTIIVSQATGVLVNSGAATLNGVLWFSNTANTAGSIAVTNAYTNNPTFAGDGYHLLTGSPAIDQGLDVDVTEDVDGEPRPMDLGYDLGADEYPGVGFAVLKQAPATFVLHDQALTYTIIVTSAGVQGATGVVLTDTLDGWQQASTATASQGGCAIIAGWGGGAVCTPGDVASGAVVRITLTAQISPSASFGQAMVNVVDVVANETANSTQITVYPTDCRARINTDPTEYTLLQDAVDAATTGDLVKVMGGTCVGINTDGGLRQVVYLDKQITIRGGYNADWSTFDADANPTLIDAQGGGRVLYATGGVNPTLEGLRFTNGDATGLDGSPWGDAGGGVYAEVAAPIFNNTHILNSGAPRGGGLYLQNSNATFYDSQFYSNTASVRGGAVYAYQSGGSFNSCRFYSNTATSTGGGIYLNRSNNVFNANVITANTSDWGAGVYLDAASPKFYNTVIADNRASVRAGALYASASSPQMWHTTIARNTHTNSTGVYATDSGGTYSNVAMTNTILVSQSVGIEVNTGSAATLNGVLWFNNSSGNTSGPVTVQNATSGDPAFMVDGYHLGSASQAIDRGVVSGVGVDIDGDTRPHAADYDLGADEYVGAVAPPTAGFDATPTSGTRPLTVTFTDQSAGSVTVWLWRFGDGVTSGETNPMHTYTQTGVFTVSQQVTGPGGSDTLTRTNYITVTEPSPEAPGVPTLIAPPNGVVTTTQNVTLYWQAGTGGTPTGYNVELDGVVITNTGTSSATVLAMGVHTWTVRAFNADGYSDWAAEWTVEVTDTLPPPGIPTLLAPPDETVTTTQNVTLHWQASAGSAPTGYNVELDGVVISSTGTSSATVLAAGVHTWTVRAFNTAGYSDWATEWTVEVDSSYRIYLPLVLRNL